MRKSFRWSEEKNSWLKEHRGVSFEEVVEAISGRLLDVRANKKPKYSSQRVFIVNIDNYPWVIPFDESETEIFLITAFPDRKLLKEFRFES